MPAVEPNDTSLKTLSGLHLWHAPLSSCSQRVRLTLSETGQSFTSNLLDLERGDHASESYQAIHPKGLVPALIDDGVLIIESVDIIRHLAADDPSLMSDVDHDLLDRANAAQIDLKLLTFEFLFRGGPPPSSEKAKAFQQNHKNAWLRQFYLDFAQGFEPDRVQSAVMRSAEGFAWLNEVLSDGRPYFSGSTFTVADIAWLPNVHRFELMGWLWENTPHLAEWFKRVAKRSSYKQALLDWENPNSVAFFREYTDIRRAAGTDITSFMS